MKWQTHLSNRFPTEINAKVLPQDLNVEILE